MRRDVAWLTVVHFLSLYHEESSEELFDPQAKNSDVIARFLLFKSDLFVSLK